MGVDKQGCLLLACCVRVCSVEQECRGGPTGPCQGLWRGMQAAGEQAGSLRGSKGRFS